MSIGIKFDVSKFKEQLNATSDKLHQATRPAAQAGAQIMYERAKALAPVSKKAHLFEIEGRVYGPFKPGNLRDSIYQAFSSDKSFKDVSTYEVSWNKKKAPYGYVAELGNSQSSAKSFIGRAVVETRSDVREAIKKRFISEVNK